VIPRGTVTVWWDGATGTIWKPSHRTVPILRRIWGVRDGWDGRDGFLRRGRLTFFVFGIEHLRDKVQDLPPAPADRPAGGQSLASFLAGGKEVALAHPLPEGGRADRKNLVLFSSEPLYRGVGHLGPAED